MRDKQCAKLTMYMLGVEVPNITPTSEEKSRLNIVAFFKDVNVDDVLLEEAPTFHNDHSNIVPPVHPQNIEQQPRLRSSTSASPEDLKAEINELRLDLIKLTGKVTLLNDYVISSFERLFKLFDPNATKEKGDDVPVSEHFNDHNFVADVPERNMTADEIKSNVKANEGVTDGVFGAADAAANDSKNCKITGFYDKFVKNHYNADVISEENEISEYIQGYYRDANVPWDTVDKCYFQFMSNV
ncbi:hypothetical protein K7X08_024870 [Anisodus acutangulus]|uniref:Uncharacterized protein n=1 Tax=Anisodus acutangulus TaxID=402998 RepID=A0A9Q1MCF5_9SOLA|nr:hypothetical protein K7X08_024870 [Anisodus acutangulus]